MGRFDGKVTIVTGAGSGIGKETACRLAVEGARVACLDITGAQEEVAKGISSSGGTAVAVHCDVAVEESVKAAVAATVESLGPPDIVCNVAGVGKFVHTTEASLADWERIISINLTGVFLMCRETIPHLLGNGGTIVNVASTAGVMGQPYSAAYCASKGGVIMLTKALAIEYLERGLRVNAVAPGGVDTPIIYGFLPPEDASNRLMQRLLSPMGMSKPEEIAGLIAFVASDEARYMSGSIVMMDGGLTA